MEPLIFLVILVVASLLRGGAKQKRQQPQPPPLRPRRPTLEAEPEEGRPAPQGRPARRTFFEEAIYMFEKQSKAPEPVPVKRAEPVQTKRDEPVRKREEPEQSPIYRQEGMGPGLFQDSDELARGIILAEVLGPPLSKRKKRGFI